MPHLPDGLGYDERIAAQRTLLDEMCATYRIAEYVAWYYTPMALAFSDHLEPSATVYDCMDELSAFKGAPTVLKEREAALLRRADLVFDRRPVALRGETAPARKHPSVSEQRRRRALRAGAPDRERSDRSGGNSASAARVLRRHRRAHGPGAARWRRCGPPGLAPGAARPGGEDRSRVAAAAAEHSLSRLEAVRRAAATTSPAGTSRCCRSRATKRRASSARPRRRNTWPPASRSSRPRSATSCARTASRAWCGSPTTRRRLRARVRRRDGRGCRRSASRRRRVPDGRRRGTAPGAASVRSWTMRSAATCPRVRLTSPTARAPCSAAARSFRGSYMFDYLVVGAGFAGATIAERLAAHARQEGADLRQAAAHRRQRVRLITTRPASWFTNTARTSSTRTRARSSTICRSSPTGVRTSTASSPRSTVSCCRFRSTWTRSTACTARDYTSFEVEEFFKSVAEPVGEVQHLGGRDRQPGRPRALRKILPQLHAQAVGARSIRARRVRHGARAGAHQPRRSVLHRHVSGDAAHGYTRMFERMLSHPNIKILLNTDYREVREHDSARRR